MARFYVYELKDPRDDSVFYVGKGQRMRAWQHAADVRKERGSNDRKLSRIRDIHAAGFEPIVRKVAEYDDEADAFAHEADLIASTSGLTNILASGGGWSITPEEAERRAEERATRIADRKLAASKAWLTNWLKVADTWPGVTFPNLKDGDAKAKEFVTLLRGLLAQPAH